MGKIPFKTVCCYLLQLKAGCSADLSVCPRETQVQVHGDPRGHSSKLPQTGVASRRHRKTEVRTLDRGLHSEGDQAATTHSEVTTPKAMLR